MQNDKKSQQTLSISDDLELVHVSVPEIPKDIIFPDELNRYLRDQVQYLTHENGMLYKNLSDAELQIKQTETKMTNLSCQLEEYQAVCPKNSLAGSAANLASSKIVELSKKLRERNSEVEVYKTKCSKLEKYIFEMEEKNKVKQSVPEVEKPKNQLEEQIKSLQDKLNGTTTKLYDARNSNIQLKNDLKLANKLLQQEVGDSFESLQSLVGTTANWRGRAQIICDLQQKNGEMRGKLKTYQEKGRVGIEAPMQMLRQDKRLEDLTKENLELKEVVQGIKRKLDAAKARNRVVESESSALRVKISTLSEQGDYDHQQITSLTGKVAHAQEIQNEAVHQKQRVVEKQQQENKNLHLELAKQTCQRENLNAQVDDQRREIENLREKVRTQQPLSPPKTIAIDAKTIKQLEAERLRLLELSKLANERLESERTSHAATHAKFRSERQKAAKMEAKVARLELDQLSDHSSTYSACSLKTKETECNSIEDRLELAEETIKVLETRLQIERQEHKTDVEEFVKILRDYSYVNRD